MDQYLKLLDRVMTNGLTHENRTGVSTRRISGAHLQFDLNDGFPLVTTKAVPFKSVVAELIGFLRGADNAAQFRDLGTKIWDQNANDNEQWLSNPHRKGRDDLGRIYGVQWRDWKGGLGHYDQLAQALWKIYNEPDSRRILVSAWNPAELETMALPPCHVLWQVMPDRLHKTMDLCVYIRSWDLFLGAPFNIASYALLLRLLAQVTGYSAKMLNVFAADVHLYDNHLEQAEELLGRTPRPLPGLVLHLDPEKSTCKALRALTHDLTPDMIKLVDYDPHPPLKAPMAV